ncbi:MAG: hypothetical protein ACOCQD_01120 [archaeon]
MSDETRNTVLIDDLYNRMSQAMSEMFEDKLFQTINYSSYWAINRYLNKKVLDKYFDDLRTFDEDLYETLLFKRLQTNPVEFPINYAVDDAFVGEPVKLYRKLNKAVHQSTLETNRMVPEDLGRKLTKSILKEQLDVTLNILVNILEQKDRILNFENLSYYFIQIKDSFGISDKLRCIIAQDLITDILLKHVDESWEELVGGYTPYQPCSSTGGLPIISRAGNVLRYIINLHQNKTTIGFKTLLLTSNAVEIIMQSPKLKIEKDKEDGYFLYNIEYFYDIFIKNYSWVGSNYPDHQDLYLPKNWEVLNDEQHLSPGVCLNLSNACDYVIF